MIDDNPRIFTRQLNRTQLVVLDSAIAFGYTLVLAAMVTIETRTGDRPGFIPGWAEYVLILAMGIPLAVRRLRPVRVFIVVFAASILALVLGVVRDGFVGSAFALYLVAVLEHRPRNEPTLPIAVATVIGLLALVTMGTPMPVEAALGSFIVGLVTLGGAWTIGRAVRERRRFAARSAAGLVERAVATERLRIARDLHDVVAHGLSLIVVKAATANHVGRERPNESEDALLVIETAGRAALGEMRQMLDVLRSDVEVGDSLDIADELAPIPTLAQLATLADRVAAAGVYVDLEVDGVEQLPDGHAIAVYRIVQESLTNVVRHAAPAACRVTVTATDTQVSIEVVDDGLGAGYADTSHQQAGRGLVGIRERVRLLGGELEAGPLPVRGFRVAARIPLVALAAFTAGPG